MVINSKTLTSTSDIYTENYIKIGDHGAIFNNSTSALVGLDGTIDWACFPDFDSDPIFDSILDSKKGGYFLFRPRGESKINQYYEEFTNILITEFIQNDKIVLRLTDFLPTSDCSTLNFPEIHRFVEVLSGINVEIYFKPSFHFGKEVPQIIENKNGFLFQGKNSSVGLSSNFKLVSGPGIVYNDNLFLGAGTYQWLVISTDINYIHKVEEYKSYQRLEETRIYWKNWTNKITYHGLWHKYLLRSALVLKGMFYEPTGLMVAAPTSSLPESIGGERNWDYRYTWVRDTTYVIEAMSMIGLKDEASKFLYGLMNMIHRDHRLRTIYPLNETRELSEKILDYSGYMNSGPVRIGNEAVDQLQVDQYGSIINAIYHFELSGGIVTLQLWDFIVEILDKLKQIWKYPDSSIWEFRSVPRHYVYSKLMSWAAFHFAGLIGKKLFYSADYEDWARIENEIKEDILANGFNSALNSFVQSYGSDEIDASLLRLPLLNFLEPTDPRVLSTIRAVETRLMNSSYLFKRYLEDDGLKGDDNGFLLLTFWYIEDLIKMGSIGKAKDILESILSMSNHLMLFSEEMDLKTNDMLGNFPQAISHLGVVRTITLLNNEFKKSGNAGILKYA